MEKNKYSIGDKCPFIIDPNLLAIHAAETARQRRDPQGECAFAEAAKREWKSGGLTVRPAALYVHKTDEGIEISTPTPFGRPFKIIFL